jgi:virginiamycin B lyase
VTRGIRRNKRRRAYRFAAIAILVLAIVSISLIYFSFFASSHASHQSNQVVAFSLQSTSQKSKYITEYQIQPNSQPNAIAVDSLGNVWFTLGANNSIANLNPTNGTVREYVVPDSNSSMVSWGIVVDGRQSVVWFTDINSNAIWSFDISGRRFTEHALPNPHSSPYQLSEDGSGNIWFTELVGGRIGQITSQGQLKEYGIPATSIPNFNGRSVGPAGIAIAKNGAVWFAEAYVGAVGSFADGVFHTYLLRGASSPVGITLDSSNHVWLTQHGASYISELNPATNATMTFSTSQIGVPTSLPYFIEADGHDNIWFNEHLGNAIGRFSPSNRSLIEYEVPTRVASSANLSGTLTMTLDGAGHPWFTELYSGKIGTLSPDGSPGPQPTLASASNEVTVPLGSNVSLELTVTSAESNSYLKSSLSVNRNLFNFSFSPSSGQGYFTSTAAIRNDANSSSETYYVTISLVSEDIVSSVIVTLRT